MPIKQVAVVTKFHIRDLRQATRHIHRNTLKAVLSTLEKYGLDISLIDRVQFKKTIRADLVITVGGDGTVLAASHFVKQTPIFGINSAPMTSTGYLCVANPKNFERLLKRVLAGKQKPLSIPRLEVFINRKRIPFLGLNDLLFACRLQGETARYTLQIGHRREFQKSSGIWVATGAGSTAAILSAGGKPFSMTSAKLQYRVREPFQYKIRYRLVKGFLNAGQKMTILPDMSHGMIFIDGGKIHYHVPKHARVTVRGGLRPLKLFL
ncbi:MAG: NAD(+)/NADH kinase [Deltaproteobacteria bacterium]|nr:NAD(+)/NADH kinase [Deltaproteobacteria bacterium]